MPHSSPPALADQHLRVAITHDNMELHAQPGPRTTPITVAAAAGQVVELHPHETIVLDLQRAN